MNEDGTTLIELLGFLFELHVEFLITLPFVVQSLQHLCKIINTNFSKIPGCKITRIGVHNLGKSGEVT